MSCAYMYGVKRNGDVVQVAEYENSYHGAMLIWIEYGKKFCGWTDESASREMFWLPGLRTVWDLAKEQGKLTTSEEVVLVSTFDNVVCPLRVFGTLAAGMEEVAAWMPKHSHLRAMASKIRDMAADPEWRGVCWNQTSVNADAWWGEYPEGADPDVADRLPYNVDRQHRHWWMFPEAAEEGLAESG